MASLLKDCQYPDDEYRYFLKDVGKYWPDDKSSHSRRLFFIPTAVETTNFAKVFLFHQLMHYIFAYSSLKFTLKLLLHVAV